MEKIPVSFGCMCSTAIFLKENGYRDRSCFFDWVDSNLIDNIRIVQDNFSHVLDKNLLEQRFKEYPHIVTNVLYNLSYVHIFDVKKSYESQIKSIKKKISRSSTNFLNILNSGRCLLVYYLRKEDEVQIIEKNKVQIESFLNKFNASLIIVSNFKKEISYLKTFHIESNNIHIPFGGDVSFPFTNTNKLEAFLNENIGIEQRNKNLAFNKKRSFKKVRQKVHNFINRFRKNKLEI